MTTVTAAALAVNIHLRRKYLVTMDVSNGLVGVEEELEYERGTDVFEATLHNQGRPSYYKQG